MREFSKFVSLLLFGLFPLYGVVAEESKSEASIPLEQAGDFGLADTNNVGIILYYGSENGVTPEQAGDWIIGKLKDRLAKRRAEDPKLLPSGIDAVYFVQDVSEGMVGIRVGYLMGGVSVDTQEIRAATTDEVLDEVLHKRAVSARLLEQ